MVGVVVATHGRLAEELLRTAEGIVGKLEACEAVSLGGVGASIDDARARLGELVKRVDGGDGVLVLTDMFGGTPANLGVTFLDKDKVEVITGLNLAMLMKLARPLKETDLLTLAREIRDQGRNAIWVASDLLRGEKS
jgi:PTS system mannose-specific IIA component